MLPIDISYILKRSKIIDEDGCWISTYAKSNYGHVRVRIGKDRRRYVLSRLAYCVYNNKEYDGDFLVRHTCNKPACFKKECLIEGTHSDNMLDSVRFGTHRNTKRMLCSLGHPLVPYGEVHPDLKGKFSNYRICPICRYEAVKRQNKKRNLI